MPAAAAVQGTVLLPCRAAPRRTCARHVQVPAASPEEEELRSAASGTSDGGGGGGGGAAELEDDQIFTISVSLSQVGGR